MIVYGHGGGSPNQWGSSALGNADTDRQNRVNFVLSAAQQGNIRAAQIILGAPPNVSGNERGMWTTAASKIGATDLGALALQEAQSRGPTWLTGNGDSASNHPGLNLFLSQSPMAVPAPAPTAPPPPVPVTPETPATPPPPPVPVIPPTPTAPPVEPPVVNPALGTDAQRQGRVNYVVQNAQRGNIRAAQILLGGPDNVSGNERDMWVNGQKNAAATDLGGAAMVAAMAKGPQWLTGNGDTAANYPGLVQFLIGSDIAHPVVEDIPTPVTPTQPTYPTTPGGGGNTIPVPSPTGGDGFGSGPYLSPPMGGPSDTGTPASGVGAAAAPGMFGSIPPLALAAGAIGLGLILFGKKR